MRSSLVALLSAIAFAGTARAEDDDTGPIEVGPFSNVDSTGTLRSMAPITGDPCKAITPVYNDASYRSECKVATKGTFGDTRVALLENRVSMDRTLVEIDDMLVLTMKDGAFAAPVITAFHNSKTTGYNDVHDATAIITKLDAGILVEMTYFQQYSSTVKPGGGTSKFLGRVFMLCRTSRGNCTYARFGNVFDTCTTQFDGGGVRYKCDTTAGKPTSGRVVL